jgi:hypothetical protein
MAVSSKSSSGAGVPTAAPGSTEEVPPSLVEENEIDMGNRYGYNIFFFLS